MAKLKISKPRKELLQYKILKLRAILNNRNPKEGEIFSAVVDLVFVFEQIIKFKISEKNILLIYKKLPDNDVVNAILKHEATKDQPTITAQEGLNLFRVLFPDSEITKNSKSAELLIGYRNEIYHHIVPFKDVGGTKLLELARNVYSIQLKTLEELVGNIPTSTDIKSTLTSEEIKELFTETVRRKIQLGDYIPFGIGYGASAFTAITSPDTTGFYTSLRNNICPRCGSYAFSEVPAQLTFRIGQYEAYYKCSNCNLELTPEEYSIAKEIMKEQNKKS